MLSLGGETSLLHTTSPTNKVFWVARMVYGLLFYNTFQLATGIFLICFPDIIHHILPFDLFRYYFFAVLMVHSTYVAASGLSNNLNREERYLVFDTVEISEGHQ